MPDRKEHPVSESEPRPLNRPVSRRAFLQGSSLAGFAAFLAACGAPGTNTAKPSTAAGSVAPPASPGASTGAVATDVPAPTGGGTLNFANWIGYIDISDNGKHYPTLEKFTAETGVEVNYQEAVDDNETFFTADLQAPLSAGQATEWDLTVLTDWMVNRLVRLGWLETMNTDAMPNFPANLLDGYVGRSFDPDTNIAAPWQSGMTGIGFDKHVTGDVTSLAALWDPANAGKITFLTEMRDTVGLAARKLGTDPSTITEEQFQAALAHVKEAADAGIVRAFTGNSYTERMLRGDVTLSMAWSGDVINILQVEQTGDQDFQWALPTEGAMLWTDNMVIPKGAPNKGQAELWINFYYEPANAATVEAWVYYVCPVKGAREAMVEIDPSIAEEVLIFPTEEMQANLFQFRGTSEDEDTRWAEDFSRVTGK
jgi:spermidine/putrescine transport system substrate-binding protein